MAALSGPTTAVPLSSFVNWVSAQSSLAQEIPAQFKQLRPVENALCYCKPTVLGKNRYKNVLPYTHTRVIPKVPEEEQDANYVNASYIELPINIGRFRYIMASAPLDTAIPAWWRMIWDQKVQLIVNLTKNMEKGGRKADTYWPESKNLSKLRDKEGDTKQKPNLQCGPITVVLDEELIYGDDVVLRRLTLSRSDAEGHSESRGVSLLHFLGWPDGGAPENWQFTRFMRILRQERARRCNTKAIFPTPPLNRSISQVSSRGDESALRASYSMRQSSQELPLGPILCHCSAGLGRSGCFVVLDALFDSITQAMVDKAHLESKSTAAATASEDTVKAHMPRVKSAITRKASAKTLRSPKSGAPTHKKYGTLGGTQLRSMWASSLDLNHAEMTAAKWVEYRQSGDDCPVAFMSCRLLDTLPRAHTAVPNMMVDIFELVDTMRKSRGGVVQTIEQYKFIFTNLSYSLRHNLCDPGALEKVGNSSLEQFEALPDHAVASIFTYLHASEVIRLFTVHKSWKPMCLVERIWEDIEKRCWAPHIRFPDEKVVKALPHIVRAERALGMGVPSPSRINGPVRWTNALQPNPVGEVVLIVVGTATVGTSSGGIKTLLQGPWASGLQLQPRGEGPAQARLQSQSQSQSQPQSLALSRSQSGPSQFQGQGQGQQGGSQAQGKQSPPANMQRLAWRMVSGMRWQRVVNEAMDGNHKPGEKAEEKVNHTKAVSGKDSTSKESKENEEVVYQCGVNVGGNPLVATFASHVPTRSGDQLPCGVGVVFVCNAQHLETTFTKLEEDRAKAEASVAEEEEEEAEQESSRKRSGSGEYEEMEEEEDEETVEQRQKEDREAAFKDLTTLIKLVQSTITNKPWKQIPKVLVVNRIDAISNQRVEGLIAQAHKFAAEHEMVMVMTNASKGVGTLAVFNSIVMRAAPIK